jgi:glycosyltransferase involved in cell wall biosynthesis
MSAPRRIRVLHVLACDQLAGSELMVASLVLHPGLDGVSHELVTLEPAGPITASVRAGERWAAALGGRGGLVGAIWRLAGVLRSREYDVVTAYGLKASVAARLLVKLLQPRAAFVCGVHGLRVTLARAGSPKQRIASGTERLLSPLVKVYDANSRAALEVLAELGIGTDRMVHIPNGLDLSLWRPQAGLSDEGGEPLILCTARFAEVKRHRDLLHALAVLRREGRPFRAVLAGAGPTQPEMRELASRLGLNSCVKFLGGVNNEQIRALLQQAAIVCLASASEGMPGALMEAMACGVAVVATDVPGTNELVVDRESGLLVPAYDPPALAEALVELLEDPDLRARLGARGRERMERHFSLEAMVRAKESLYQDVARSR